MNFLDLSADANSQTLTNNLIAYLAAPVSVGQPASIPTLSEWGMALMALGLMFVALRKLPRAAG